MLSYFSVRVSPAFILFFFSVTAMLSGAVIPSWSGGLHYAPFTIVVYPHKYKSYSDTEPLGTMLPTGDEGTD